MRMRAFAAPLTATHFYGAPLTRLRAMMFRLERKRCLCASLQVLTRDL